MAVSREALELLAELRDAYSSNGGWPLHVRDLRAKRSSTSTIHAHLRKLEKAGLVERGPSPNAGWRPQ